MKARPKLLEAAISEFAENGFEGTSTASIARRAKVPQPLVHHHFGSKEELFRTVLDALFDEFRAAVLEKDGSPGDPFTILRRFVLFTARRPELARIWMIESARPGPHSEYIIEKHIGPLTEMMKPLLRPATESGLLPAADEMMLLYAMQGLGSYPFLVTEQVRHLSGTDPQSAEFAERYADAVLAILGAKGDQK
jgi:AcrR family transcriptional regulator